VFGSTLFVSPPASRYTPTRKQKSRKSFPCHTSEKRACKSFACHTSKKRVCKSFSCHTFSNFQFPVPLWNAHRSPTAVTSNHRSLTPLESILTETDPLNSFRMNTYEKKGRGHPSADLRDCRTAHSRKINHLIRTNPGRPLRFAVLGCNIRSGFSLRETSSLLLVSNQMSGPKARNSLVTDLWSLITLLRARKAPRV